MENPDELEALAGRLQDLLSGATDGCDDLPKRLHDDMWHGTAYLVAELPAIITALRALAQEESHVG